MEVCQFKVTVCMVESKQRSKSVKEHKNLYIGTSSLSTVWSLDSGLKRSNECGDSNISFNHFEAV